MELKHPNAPGYPIQQTPIHQVACEYIVDQVDYIDETGPTVKCYSNLHKALSPEYRPMGNVQDVANVAAIEGSDEGHAEFKQRLKAAQGDTLNPESFVYQPCALHFD